MAHINRYMGKDGVSYRVRVFLGSDKNGKQIVKSRTYKAKDLTHSTAATMLSEVEKKAEAWEAELKHRPVKTKERADKAILNSFIPEWEEWLVRRANANIISEATVAYYKRDYKNYCKDYFENYTVEGVTSAVAKKFISDMRTGVGFERTYSPKSTSHALTAINSLFAFLIDEKQLITANPFAGMTIPRDKSKGKKRRTKSLTQEEFYALMKALDSEYDGKPVSIKWRAFFKTMLTTGLRVEEMVALHWNDLYLKNGYHMLKVDSAVTVDVNRKAVESEFLKTEESNRNVQLPSLAYDALMLWKEDQKNMALFQGDKWRGNPLQEFDNQYIFSSENGEKPMNKGMPARALHNIIKRWNDSKEGKRNPIKDITAYDLRHTNTTLQIGWGVSPTQVAYSLGHVNLSMVNNVYGHTMENNTIEPSPFDTHTDQRHDMTARRMEIMKMLEAMSTDVLEELIDLYNNARTGNPES